MTGFFSSMLYGILTGNHRMFILNPVVNYASDGVEKEKEN